MYFNGMYCKNIKFTIKLNPEQFLVTEIIQRNDTITAEVDRNDITYI